MRDAVTGLTFKELSIADAYLSNGFNQLKAFQQSKYSQSCKLSVKRVNAHKVLTKPHIQAYIKQKTTEISDLTREEMIKYIQHGLTTAKERNNLSALARFTDLGCRTLGMLRDNVNITDVVEQQKLQATESLEVIEIAKVRVKQFINRPAKEA